MANFNADTEHGVADPLTITINEKQYIVAEVTGVELRRITSLANLVVDGKLTDACRKAYPEIQTAEEALAIQADHGDIIPAQMAMLLNVDPSEFAGVPIRKLNSAMRWIMDAILDPTKTQS